MEEQSQERRFSREEVGELIETATRLDQMRADGEGLGEREVRQVAAELGISQDAVQRALEERARSERMADAERHEAEAARTAAVEIESTRRDKRRKSVNEWKAHTTSYISVIGGLAAIDFFTDGSFEWFFYPAAGWGIAYLIHTLNVLFRVDD